MSEVIDYVKKFEEMIKSEQILKLSIDTLTQQRDALHTELADLEAKRDHELLEIADGAKKALNEITAAKAEYEAMVHRESTRLDEQSKTQEARETEQLAVTDDQARQNSALAEREERLDQVRDNLQAKQDRLETNQRSLDAKSDDLKLQESRIAEAKVALDKRIQDMQSERDDLDRQDDETAQANLTLNKRQQELKDWADILDQRQVDIEALEATLGDKISDVTIKARHNEERFSVNKTKEDELSSRETALNSFKLELDLREARMNTAATK